jgi:hypothetical protein
MKLLLVYLLLAPFAFAQELKPVDMSEDPHYSLLLGNDKVRVFEFALRPLEQSYVRHDHNYLTVTLQDSEVVQWSQGQSPVANFRLDAGDVRFSFGGPAGGIRQDRMQNYRNVTVEFLNPKVTSYGYQADRGAWDYGGSVVPPPVDPRATYATRLPLGEAVVKVVQLLSGEVLPEPEASVDCLVIAITDIDLMTEDGKRFRKSKGEIVWIPAGTKTALKNRAGDAVRFVVVELK